MHGIEVVIEALVCALTTNYIYEKYNKKQKLKNVTKNKKIIIENLLRGTNYTIYFKK